MKTYDDIEVEIYVGNDLYSGKRIVGIMLRRDVVLDSYGVFQSAEYLGAHGWVRVGEMQTIPGYLQILAENVTLDVNSHYRPKHMRKGDQGGLTVQ